LLKKSLTITGFQLKCEDFKIEIQEYAKKHGLTIEVDREREYLAIFKNLKPLLFCAVRSSFFDFAVGCLM